MGFKVPSDVTRLDLPYEDLEGLDVWVRSATIGQAKAALKLSNLSDGDGYTAEDLAAIDAAVEAFVSALDSWNLEYSDGTPIPTTVDSIYGLDISFVVKLIVPWMMSVRGIAQESDDAEVDDETELIEESMPTELFD